MEEGRWYEVDKKSGEQQVPRRICSGRFAASSPGSTVLSPGLDSPATREPCPRPGRPRVHPLRGDGVGFFGVDAEVGDGFFDDFFLDFSVEEKLVERGEGDEARVHFKEIAEGFAAVAAAENVGAERGDAAGNPRADHVRQSF